MVKTTYIGLEEELKKRRELAEANESRIESQTKYNKQRYEILKAHGRCITCGNPVEKKGFSRCNACRKKCIKYATKSYKKHKGGSTI